MKLSSLNPSLWTAKIGATVLGWIVAALIVVLIGLTVWGLKRKVVVQNEVIREVAGQEVADRVWNQGSKALAEIKRDSNAKTEDALNEEPDWADAVVPDVVADRLRKPNR